MARDLRERECMLIWILLGVFTVGLVFSYVMGVQRERDWAKPILVVCALGLAGTALLRAFEGRLSGERARPDIARREYRAARMLAGALSDRVPAGAAVFILHPMAMMPRRLPGHQAQWESAFDQTFGEWRSAGVSYAPEQTASGFETALRASQNDVDAIISFQGLPEDLPEMSMFDSPGPPAFGAYCATGYDVEAIRQWLQKELVHAVVLKEGPELKLYTPENPPSVR
jgi:hypothetical protein